jgi:Uma2 family endonuclease
MWTGGSRSATWVSTITAICKRCILSPEDRLSRFTERTDEYLDFGIENIWIVDPARRLAYRATTAGLQRAASGEITVPETPIRVVLSELFAELDRA